MATGTEKLPESIDLSHHLSVVSRARPVSPLKDLQKYWGKPGLISLAGGLPSPEFFPFFSVGADILLPGTFPAPSKSESGTSLSWLWNLFSSGKVETETITIPKYARNPEGLDLATLLQYNVASGHPRLHEFALELTKKVFKPAYSNYTIMAHTGNTDGWMKAVLTLCNPGEGILTSAWTYPSAMAGMTPYNIKAVPVAMDYEGMRADYLHELLLNWDAEARGMPRPHVMYTVPVGQNPTGATMGAARKQKIYSICVEFDIIIVEDDPYYFIQEGQYVPESRRVSEGKPEVSLEEFIQDLVPSYLRFDYQGRVIRMDTFSKTVAPGCRLGWFTCNPVFAERLLRQAETTTAAPCGFSQGLVLTMLNQWGLDGYLRWLQGLQNQYVIRRNHFLDSFAREFDLRIGTSLHSGCYSGCDVYTAHPKRFVMKEKALSNQSDALFSFVPPTSGMFVWLKLHLGNHPKRSTMSVNELELALWNALGEENVLFGPGQMFAANTGIEEEGVGHFRISFSNAELDNLTKAVSIFARVITKFFEN